MHTLAPRCFCGNEFLETDAYRTTEGPVAKAIETCTVQLSSDTFLWMALGAMAVSAIFQARGDKHSSLFVVQWAPAFLLFGIYNKARQTARLQLHRKRGIESPYDLGGVTAGQSLTCL